MLNFKFDISKVTFEDSFLDIADGHEQLYFVGPEEWLKDKYPEAIGATIRLVFSCEQDILMGNPCYEGISPVKTNLEGDLIDYDWNDIFLTHREVMQLVDKAASYFQKHKSYLPKWADKYKAQYRDAYLDKKDVKVLMVALVGDETMCVAAYSQETSRTKIINVFKGEEASDIFNTLTSVDHYDKEEK